MSFSFRWNTYCTKRLLAALIIWCLLYNWYSMRFLITNDNAIHASKYPFNISSIFLTNTSCNDMHLSNDVPFNIDIVWLWNGQEFDLRYSLRSVCLFIKWYHKIYIILPKSTQIPKWINKSYINTQQINFIPESYFFLKFNLTHSLKYGTNNSEQIESMIHHIDGLSEYFIYFNDDMMIGRPIPWYFFYKYNHKYGKYLTNIHPKYAFVYSNVLFKRNFAYQCAEKHDNIMKLRKDNKLPIGRVSSYIEHHPRGYIKSELLLFESMYPEFFKLIRSHNGYRWNSCQNNKMYFEESIWFYMLRYKIDHVFQQFHGNILQKNDLPQNLIYHSWIRNQFGNLGMLLSLLKDISILRPYTFNVQGNYILNTNDELFGKYLLVNFYQQYFSLDNNKCIGICGFENDNLYDIIEDKYDIKLNNDQLIQLNRMLNSGIFRDKMIRKSSYKTAHLLTPSDTNDIDANKSVSPLNVLKFVYGM
eukprot:220142_1